MFLPFMLVICSVSIICGVGSIALCPSDEYRVGLECCPACRAGKSKMTVVNYMDLKIQSD